MGAFAYVTETTSANAAGRITVRNLNGRTYNYSYDAQGRLIAYTDDQDASNNASYEYDHEGRRIKMTVGDSVTRMVYDADDVVAEYVDEDGDGTVDRLAGSSLSSAWRRPCTGFSGDRSPAENVCPQN